MTKQYIISQRDHDRFNELLRWYDREKNLRNQHRRRPALSGDGVAWFEVTQCLTYPDTTKDPSDPLYLGYSKYTLKVYGGESEIEVEYAIGFEGDLRPLRECFPWYVAGEVVPVIMRKVDGIARHFIDLAIQWSGDESNASLRWNEDEARIMAVYK